MSIYFILSISLSAFIMANCYSLPNEDDELSYGTVKMLDDQDQPNGENTFKSAALKGNCETLPSSIHVTKEEHDQAGNVLRSCEGNVMVNKCEGTCVSQLQPSVNTPTGFLKVRSMHRECVCCRESHMKQKEVFLTNCFDPDGKRLTDDKMSNMLILVHEPDECKCHKCG